MTIQNRKKEKGTVKMLGMKAMLSMFFELTYTRCTSNLCTPSSLSRDICENTVLPVLGSGTFVVPQSETPSLRLI